MVLLDLRLRGRAEAAADVSRRAPHAGARGAARDHPRRRRRHGLAAQAVHRDLRPDQPRVARDRDRLGRRHLRHQSRLQEPALERRDAGQQPGRRRHERAHPEQPHPFASRSTARVAGLFGLASAVTLGAGVMLEESGNELANRVGVNGVIFGATVLAAASALPEISSGVAAVALGDHALAMGDILGGNAFQVCLFLVADIVAGQPVLESAGNAERLARRARNRVDRDLRLWGDHPSGPLPRATRAGLDRRPRRLRDRDRGPVLRRARLAGLHRRRLVEAQRRRRPSTRAPRMSVCDRIMRFAESRAARRRAERCAPWRAVRNVRAIVDAHVASHASRR